MKKIVTIVFLLFILSSALVLSACDQESVDSMTNGIVDAGAEALGPFFEQSENENNGADQGIPTTQSSNSSPGGSVDTPPSTQLQPGADQMSSSSSNNITNDIQ